MPNWRKNLNRPAQTGRGVGVDGSADAAGTVDASDGQKEAAEMNATLIVQRRHIDWVEHQICFRWLQDSYEGGDRYRNAVYGPDRRGQPLRNLMRHKREYPDPQTYPDILQGFASSMAVGENSNMQGGMGAWPGQLGAYPYAVAMDDDYELRRARTPVPEFLSDAIEHHLSKVYDQEVHREGPPDITEWWKDCDGKGTPIDDFMQETIAPLLLVLGCLDVCLDHPAAPLGETVVTHADELRLGLDKCIASYILPQNMVWWRTNAAGRYVECLVREYADPADRNDTDEQGNPIDPDVKGETGDNWRKSYVRWRLWNEQESYLFDFAGSRVLEHIPHPYGMVPIVRLMDLKKHRTPNVGKSRYHAVAEYMREFYNRDSELILSDTVQAHPFLSGPEDYCKADNTLSIGPGYILPMKKNADTGAYTGWTFVSPPKDPAASIRENKADLIDMMDRATCRTKPAGIAGTTAGGVAQSGLSKEMDGHEGHKKLTSIAKSLAKNELALAEYACLVLRLRRMTPPEREQISVVYPSRFQLKAADEMTLSMQQLQLVLQQAGDLPMAEAMGIRSITRQLLLGLADAEYEALDAEIDLCLKSKSKLKEALKLGAMADAGISDKSRATEGPGSAEQAAGTDPTGQSGSTMVSTPSFTG